MRGFSVGLLGLFMGAWPLLGQAASVWRDLPLHQVPTLGERLIQPLIARVVATEPDRLRQSLFAAPHEFSQQAPVRLTLPMPDGSEAEFEVWQTDLMHPDLAARYPDIQTWVGQGLNGLAATARLNWGRRGFHAMIFSPQGTVFIDPLQRGDTEHYQSYFKRHALRAEALPPDQVIANPDAVAADAPTVPARAVRAAGTLRQYRLAVAATGDYSHFHDPPPAPLLGLADKAVVLSEMVTAIHRVTGIYERDFSVRMQLVANNDDVIFQHPLADPYVDGSLTGLEGLPMLFSNTPILDVLVGAANYDVGHVFSVGGGGVAQLGSVCGTSKGAGVTGLPNPVADPFYVDYVAHELGHQFGANHTFNGVNGSCSGGNRNGSTAYEPGSATTIMGYAGICGADNIQPNSDDHFHAVSFDEVFTFVSETGGADCAEIIDVNNQAPLVSAGRSDFSIPRGTPFTLVGEASDPDGDALLAVWEQFDLGPAAQAGQSYETGPLFRSYPLSASLERTIPRIEDLAAGVSTIGEVLPQSARALSFRLTVRDNRAGGGGVAHDTMRFQVAADAGPFRVTQPNSSQAVEPGDALAVTWDVAGTDQAPVNCAGVDILLSDDGGLTFPMLLARGVENTGQASVTLPDQAIEAARIKVKCSDNIFFALSPGPFAIEPLVGARSAGAPARGGALHWWLLGTLVALRLRRRSSSHGSRRFH